MKKSVFFTMLVAAIGLASCSQTPKSNFKTDVDTLSYMLGVSNTQGLSNYAMLRLGVDSTHLDEFFKGIEEGMKQISAKEKAYVSGLSIGQQVASDMFENINESIFTGDSTMSLNKENYLAGFLDGAKNKSFITPDSANVYSRVKGKEVKERSIANLYSEYKKQNEDFLEDNKTKEGVKVTPSGLQYKILTEGHGEIPTDSVKVEVHYEGKMIDGTKFDSSYDRKKSSTFSPYNVIQGWREASTMMPVGSKWEIYIPQELGYGAMGTSAIKPFSTLIFQVELLGIQK